MQDPGAPPQRPQEGAGADAAPRDSAPTAKTLIVRAVLFEPHSGHSIRSRELIERMSFSKRCLQLSQVYS